ncbi:LacI family DNA-binding transcriptional regulator [Demequina activiva]|uniref:LacI family transcriptional regulator n=1 Tax=Demequina activiva TaxID=1582364 RepID=A0A919Q292_9MICO|nr:LacI family DNA-binding transcriptional regulator [Demequina activiva]GIG53927.1 LacI family transcriptional regulator [Demequina activiva]
MANGNRGPSMHDVAARAGVSHQTVSRVLNDFPGIRPETRDRVLAAIDELGYRRNLAARALVTGRTQTIGMIGPEIPDIGPLSTLHGVERAARAAGLHTMMTSADPASESVREALDFLVGRGVDAIALVAQQRSVREALEGFDERVPVIHLLTGGDPAGAAASIDQRAGARLAMDHLLDLGHTRIQHVSGPPSYTEAQLRREEYGAAMSDRGLEPLEIIEGDWTTDSGFAAGSALDPTATAVFCGNDDMALGLIHALVTAGRDVPGDISVVGFDDTPASRHSLPPLTTVHQDFGAVGAWAVALMIAARDGLEPPSAELIAPTLVERSSTAPL